VDVNALLQGTIDLLEYSLGDGIVLETALSPNLPAVFVDPGQLENALTNLALNAADATHGKGRITFSTQQSREDTIEISVSDTGYGISPEMMARVFEPFFTTKTTAKGSGLGLSMVYGLVRQSDGEIGIDSESGQGTSIHLRQPIASQSEPSTAAAEATDRAAEPQLPGGGGERILVVDDDEALLKLSTGQLGELGYRVVKASDGNEALALLAQAVRRLHDGDQSHP
jgi:CheY-like chemotaxis protein